MCGTPDYDVAELREAVRSGLPKEQADWLWSVVEEMTPEERGMFLVFITGSSAVPAGGFRDMPRPIAIVVASRPDDSLPVSHTCFNTLELPSYSSREVLREKLLYAIRNCGATDFGMA